MEKKKTILDYIGQIFQVFGFSIICLNIFCILFGESAKTYSTMFFYGNGGLSVETMLQFLVIAIIIVALRFIFFTDTIIKKASVKMRVVCMFALIILIMALCIWQFGWFPIDMWKCWLMFFLCFGISATVSVIVSGVRESSENKKMEEALKRFKEGEEL